MRRGPGQDLYHPGRIVVDAFFTSFAYSPEAIGVIWINAGEDFGGCTTGAGIAEMALESPGAIAGYWNPGIQDNIIDLPVIFIAPVGETWHYHPISS